MDKTEQKRSFLIRVLYIAFWGIILYALLKYAMPLFMPFVIAFLLAFLLKPLINLLAKKTRLNRKLISIVLLTVLYIIIGLLLVLLGARLIVYLGNLFSRLPHFYSTTLEPAFEDFGNWFDNFINTRDPALAGFFSTASDSLSNAASSVVGSISSGAINLITGIATSVPWFLVAFLITIIASYFFVVDYYRVTSFLVRQLSEKHRRLLFVIKDYVVNVLFRFARAYLIILSITFAEVAVGLLILRVPYAFLIALITALVDILPVLGTGTIMIPWAVYCLVTGDYFLGIGLAILYIIITVVRQIIEPRIVGRQIGLYPLITLICMFIGARLFGFWGLLGFPVAITVIIYLNRKGEISLFKE